MINIILTGIKLQVLKVRDGVDNLEWRKVDKKSLGAHENGQR